MFDLLENFDVIGRNLLSNEFFVHESLVHGFIHIAAGLFLFMASLAAIAALRVKFARRNQGWLALQMAILLVGFIGLGEAAEYFMSAQIHDFFRYLQMLAISTSLFLLWVAINELHAFYFDHTRKRVIDNKTVALVVLSTIALPIALGYQTTQSGDKALELPFLTMTAIPTVVMAYLLFRRSMMMFLEQKKVPLMNLSIFSTTVSIVPLLTFGTVLLALVIWLGRIATYFELTTVFALFHSLQSIFHGGLSFALIGSTLMLVLSKDMRWIEDRVLRAGQLMSLGEMANSLAEELTNPLMAIIGYSTIMLEDKKIPAARRKDLLMIQQEASRAAQTTKETLDFAGHSQLRFQVVDAEGLIDQILNLLEPRIKQVGIEVKKSVSRPLPLISVDSNQIKQVFVNIVNNALDTMPHGGSLDIYINRGEDGIELTFSDNGDGIPDENLSRIFEPFFSSRPQSGTGLGLSLAKSIIQKHNGSINVTSQVGYGSSFIITLPAVAEEDTFWRLESSKSKADPS